MNDNIVFSIIIATRNRVASLKRVLDNIVADPYPHREIIVIDAASSDGTTELLRAYGTQINKWISEPDKGEYDAYNKGLRMATGNVIKIMSDDDVQYSNALTPIAQYLRDHPDTDVVLGRVKMMEECPTGDVRAIGVLPMPFEDYTMRNYCRNKFNVCIQAAFIRRSVFTALGEFSTDYQIGDVEFWFRCFSGNIRFATAPTLVLEYHLNLTSGVTTRKRAIAFDHASLCWQYLPFMQASRAILRSIMVSWILSSVCEILHFHPSRMRLHRALVRHS
jgi:glycosyltransferase involved in cell wall biosynthesis